MTYLYYNNGKILYNLLVVLRCIIITKSIISAHWRHIFLTTNLFTSLNWKYRQCTHEKDNDIKSKLFETETNKCNCARLNLQAICSQGGSPFGESKSGYCKIVPNHSQNTSWCNALEWKRSVWLSPIPFYCATFPAL